LDGLGARIWEYRRPVVDCGRGLAGVLLSEHEERNNARGSVGLGDELDLPAVPESVDSSIRGLSLASLQ
jgi:hypothetical protein